MKAQATPMVAAITKKCLPPCEKFSPLADGHSLCISCCGLDHAQAAVMKPNTLGVCVVVCMAPMCQQG